MNSNEHSPEKLQSLEQLITALTESDIKKYNRIFHSVQFSQNAFDSYCSWSEDCYTRNCIIDTEKFELILICWCEGHKTPIHDHGGEECWVKVIEGCFEETIYKEDDNGLLSLVKTSKSQKGEITYMKDFMGFHRLENIAKSNSISLHLYAKPIRSCRMLDEDSNQLVEKEMSYCTVS
ncbi:cysteine dioxygenase [Polaribacter tangerinus]|uniref:cysteine dioxygenase n=1 Tax=Polaribacter tangerinus TaxID=1920034 RepID=UPI001E541554|nr:cysteine dioxygenase family protein [Polaribacter tangerinus]